MFKATLYYINANYLISVDNPSLLAQTVHVIMLICLNGGPKFHTILNPTSKLTSAFLCEQSELSV